jgi:hypothetical protein
MANSRTLKWQRSESNKAAFQSHNADTVHRITNLCTHVCDESKERGSCYAESGQTEDQERQVSGFKVGDVYLPLTGNIVPSERELARDAFAATSSSRRCPCAAFLMSCCRKLSE